MTESVPPPGRGARVGIAVAVAIAAVGFFTGTRGNPVRTGYREPDALAHAAQVGVAPRQADMESARYAARRAEQAKALTAMALPPRTALDAVALDALAYGRDVAARSVGRAYDGAPPTIPHAIDQRGTPACLACHESGLAVEGKIARPLSHESYASCTQCHVTRDGVLPSAERLAASVSEQSSFVGLAAAGHGARAWPGAPPQLPHRTFMRQRCVACHGVWATGLASSHPYRQSCTQCHALAADADQMPHSEALGDL